MSTYRSLISTSSDPATWVLKDINDSYLQNMPASSFKRIDFCFGYIQALIALAGSIQNRTARLGEVIVEYRKERSDVAPISQNDENPRSCPVLFSKDLRTYPLKEDESIFQAHMNSSEATLAEKLNFCLQYNTVLKKRAHFVKSCIDNLYKAIYIEVADRQPDAKKMEDAVTKEIEESIGKNRKINPSPPPVNDPKTPVLSEKRKEPLSTVANPLSNPAEREEEKKKDKPSQDQSPSIKRQRS